MRKPITVDQYISGFPPAVQDMLQELRKLIRESAPDAVEGISYGMPAYKLNGPLAYFAAHLNHLGYYPAGTSTVEVYEKADYTVTKGSVHFPYGQTLPADLIRKMVKFRVEENRLKKAKR